MGTEEVAALLEGGRAAAHAGHRNEAQHRFQSALRLDPDNPTALLWLAWLEDDPAASLAYAEHALARDPNNTHACTALAWAREQANAAAPRRRWGRAAVTIILCLLLALTGGTLIGSLLAETPAAAAPNPTATSTVTPSPTPTATPTDIPTWTPTFTPSPTSVDPSSPTLLTASTPAPTIATATTSLVVPTLPPSAFHGDMHWIDVNLTNQTLSAYEGQKLVRFTPVSTGLPQTPTPIGLFHIHTKLHYDDMEGDDYYLRNVPYVMYFYKAYALHGTYWHANFGHPASHGCVNIPTEHAAWLYEWAEVGTLVSVHE